MRDGQPPDVINGELKVTVTEYVQPQRNPPPLQLSRDNLPTSLSDFRRRWWKPRPRPPRTELNKLPPVTYTIPFDGIVEFPVKTSDTLERLSIEVGSY